MAGVAPQKSVGVPTSTTQHLQGLLTRKATTAEPKSLAQYFSHVADLTHVNHELTALRRYNLKRRWKVSFHGYESVLNRKKRSAATVSRPSVTGPAHLTRAVVPPSSQSSSSANSGGNAGSSAAARATAKAPARPTPTPIAAAPAPSPAPAPAHPVAITPATLKPAPSPAPVPQPVPAPVAVVQKVVPPPTLNPVPLSVPPPSVQARQMPGPGHAQGMPVQPQPVPVPAPPVIPRRSDFIVGTRVMIRHTADLVACGARNLVGKTGRIVAVPQVYGQEVYSVYIDEHETMFQVPFNALVLISPPAPTPMPINMQHQPPPRTMHQLGSGIPVQVSAPGPAGAAQTTMGGLHGRPTPSIEDIKLEHSYQLHRLMQQQYREIQVLQQQYAECRLVNPAALPSIQKELSKLRLVHLSQVQTLKSKQALDLLGK